MTACARCEGHGTEDEWEKQACQMCGGSGDAVPCQEPIAECHEHTPFCPPTRCGEPSVTWDDESPRCHRHDPETMKKVREQVAHARGRR